MSPTVSGAHRNPAQFSAEPLREADTYFPSNPTPCSLMTAFLDIWKEVTEPQIWAFWTLADSKHKARCNHNHLHIPGYC